LIRPNRRRRSWPVQAWSGGQHHGDRSRAGMSHISSTWRSRDEAQGPGRSPEVESLAARSPYTSFDQTVYHTPSRRFLENALGHPRRHARELGLRPRGVVARTRGDPRGGADERGQSGRVVDKALFRRRTGPPVRASRHRVRRHDPEDHARGSPRLLPRELRSGNMVLVIRGGGPENVPPLIEKTFGQLFHRFRAGGTEAGRAAAGETRVVVKEKDARAPTSRWGSTAPR